MILIFSVVGPSSPPISSFAALYPSIHAGCSSSPMFVSVSGASPKAFSGRGRARCPPAAAPRRGPWTRDAPKPMSRRVPLWQKGLEQLSRPCENLGVGASDHFRWFFPSLGSLPGIEATQPKRSQKLLLWAAVSWEGWVAGVPSLQWERSGPTFTCVLSCRVTLIA